MPNIKQTNGDKRALPKKSTGVEKGYVPPSPPAKPPKKASDKKN